MKKILLSVFSMASLSFSASAATYMNVRTFDGKVMKYDVEDVIQVTYESVLPTDYHTIIVDTTGTTSQGATVSGRIDGYYFVDLGLPSGKKWATHNVGAMAPIDHGDYFAWGETSPKQEFFWENYQFGSSMESLTKYFPSDDKKVLDAADDAVRVNWGETWSMPTEADAKELIEGCSWQWVTNFKGLGVSGKLGTSKTNGNTIFFSTSGYYDGATLDDYKGTYGDFWTATIGEGDPVNMGFTDKSGPVTGEKYRYWGRSVRGVYAHKIYSEDDYIYMFVETVGGAKEMYRLKDVEQVDYSEDYTKETLAQGATVSGRVGDYTYVDLGLSVKWATYNVGATSPIEIGDYFAWGESAPKESYAWSNYKFGDSKTSLTKYTSSDNKTTLNAEDDAATVICGKDWRMPTSKEAKELIDNCSWKWTDNFKETGKAGMIGTSLINGNTIFICVSGYYDGSIFDDYKGKYGEFWTSSIEGGDPVNLGFTDKVDHPVVGVNNRYFGRTVRAVTK